MGEYIGNLRTNIGTEYHQLKAWEYAWARDGTPDEDGVCYLRARIGGEAKVREFLVRQGSETNRGDCWAWNGNMEYPTLLPSIRTFGTNGQEIWHGWLCHGVFYDV